MKQKKISNRVAVPHLFVNSIDTSSGIFVGINHAHYWSSHRKNNYGFGSVSNSQIFQNYSCVEDQDVIDTPIYNKPTIVEDRQTSGIENKIDIGEININVLNTAAAVSVGENDLNAWSAHSKRNAGQGRYTGAILNTQNSSQIFDGDVADSLITNLN